MTALTSPRHAGKMITRSALHHYQGRNLAEAPQQRPPTLSEYAATVIGRRRLRPATLALYEKLLRLAITPTFGDRQPSEISVAEVTAWYRSINATPTQQANAYGLVKSIF